MGPNKNENREVNDWLAGNGGKVFAGAAILLVVWGIFTRVFS